MQNSSENDIEGAKLLVSDVNTAESIIESSTNKKDSLSSEKDTRNKKRQSEESLDNSKKKICSSDRKNENLMTVGHKDEDDTKLKTFQSSNKDEKQQEFNLTKMDRIHNSLIIFKFSFSMKCIRVKQKNMILFINLVIDHRKMYLCVLL